jgi:hypothetical protein
MSALADGDAFRVSVMSGLRDWTFPSLLAPAGSFEQSSRPDLFVEERHKRRGRHLAASPSLA